MKFQKLVIIPVIIISILLCSYSYKHLSAFAPNQSEIYYIPNSKYVKTMSLGHSESVASLFWISALIEYGGSLFGEGEFKWFSSYGNITTSLDSLMFMPYYFIAATANQKDSTIIELLDRGIRVFPEHWQLGLYYSSFLTNQYGDYPKAATIMEQYLSLDSLPEYVKRIPRSLRMRQKPRSEASLLLLSDYLDPKNTGFRKGIEKQLISILDIAESRDSVMLSNLLSATALGKIAPQDAYFQILQLPKKEATP